MSARLWLVLAIVMGLAASWAAGLAAARRADAALAREAQVSASLFDAVLRNVLERYRALPMVLASDGDVVAVLEQADAAAALRLDARLAMLARRTDAAAIYVIAANGRTIAASNAGQPLSFVGRDFTFRAYFAEAMAKGRGEQFALGTTTNQPGLYLSARVDAGGRPLGVVVTKIDFSAVERQWRRTPTPVFVTDKAGVVIITSVEPWRFSPEPVLALAAELDNPVHLKAAVPGRPAGDYVRARVPTGMSGWTLNLLQPASPAEDAAATAASTLTLLVSALLILAGWWWQRRRTRDARQAAARAAAQAELEARVAERTRELRDANDRLLTEIEERRRAEAALLLLSAELEQANRLTTLGQIAAGVTHEINQPVAAIATWAHNARMLLARGSNTEVEAALGTIHGLTERIGRITGELRDFARKSDGPPTPVLLAEAIAGTRLLVGSRTRSGDGVMAIDSSGVPAGLAVLADRTRLEQVLVNLLQNALEAGASRVAISAETACNGRSAAIRVSDDGPGVAPAMAATLFMPFQTSKPTGLGLGLVISRDICRAMGGDLVLEAVTCGSIFCITLPAAAP
jgi:two-component system C4-dicarboxylate transport sensor histidine kinase DctB